MTRDLFVKGDLLGEYEIQGRLRAGGMATLFVGRHHGAAGFSRQVVIKVIHPHLAEDEMIVRMFIDEAKISSNISHPNVVYVEKFGEHDGVYYMVMEYVDGCSLEQLLRTLSRTRERLPPEVAAHIAIETAAGLHAAHETAGDDGALLGIVHRDVSPSNVLITRDGRIKVIDFGIAKARNRLGGTKSGHGLKGKLRYMSPEQAWGRDLDRRTDVYALGIVLWELLTCRPLFRSADDLALLELVRHPEIPPPSQHNPDVTDALDAVVLRATAKDAEHRLATADDLRRELMQAVPSAMAIHGREISKLVTLVRETLGPSVLDAGDRKATTPAVPSILDEKPTEIGPPSGTELSSVRNAAGEVGAPRKRSKLGWVALAGMLAVCGIVAFIVMRNDGESIRASTVTPPPVAKPESVVEIDAGVASVPVDAAPAKLTSRPVIRHKPDAKPTGVQAVEVDGVTLADEPTTPKAKAKPKQPKSNAVNVDGTVLAK